jgi:cell division transport system permease protein
MISAIILVTFICMMSVGSALLMQRQMTKIQGEWYNRVEVSVWMCMDNASEQPNCAGGAASESQISAIQTLLNSDELKPFVKQVTLQSQEDVYKEFMENAGDTFSGVDVGSFGPIFRINLNNPNDYQIIHDAVNGKPGVYSVVDQSSVFKPLFELLGKLQIAVLFVAVVLMVVAVLLVSTTIRLSAVGRKRETEIMRLVGASNFFIQLPFVLEGVFAALIGSLLACGSLFTVMHFWLSRWISENFGVLLGQLHATDVVIIAPYLIIMSVVLAALSSVVTLRKWTKI